MAISPQIISPSRVDSASVSDSSSKTQQSSAMASGQDSFADALKQGLQRTKDSDRREAAQQSRADNGGRKTAESGSASAKPNTGVTNAEQKTATSKDAKAPNSEAQAHTPDDPSDNTDGRAIDFDPAPLEAVDAAPKSEDEVNFLASADSGSEPADGARKNADLLPSGASWQQSDAGGRRPSKGALMEGQVPTAHLVKGANRLPDAPAGQSVNGSPAASAAVSSNPDALVSMTLESAAVNLDKSVKASLGETFAKVAGMALEPSPSPSLAEASALDAQTVTGVQQALQTSLSGGGRVAVAVEVRFGSENWSGQVAERSAQLAFQNIQSAQLQLDPPELGPLSVKIHMHQDQAVVQFVSGNAQVREALDGTMNRLRELLQEQGIDLLEANVRDESQSQGRERRAAAEHNRGFGESPLGDGETQKTVIEVSSGIDFFV